MKSYIPECALDLCPVVVAPVLAGNVLLSNGYSILLDLDHSRVGAL